MRDRLLGFPFTERDWVVVGSSPDAMLEDGFQAVGKDFPVFLHPQSKEEYALARTERKTAPGYSGFTFHTDPDITLEQDLQRRDLTINAMAEDELGSVIDPYQGQRDLQQKLLRHVSEAFCEDPVRILRVARFAARYHHLGFSIAPETMALMRDMVDSGEADSLVAERVWKETERALRERNPEIFFESLRQCGALARILPELDNLYGVPQPEQHHPEIDCGIHSLMSLQQACKLSDDSRVRFAALIHDVGKAMTPKDQWPRHIAHEARSLPLIDDLCARMAVPKPFRELARQVAQDHTNCHRAKELTPPKLLALLHRVDALRRPEHLEHFLQACEADARGRTGFEDRPYPQADYLKQARRVCNDIQARDVMSAGIQGKAIGEALKKQRQQALKAWKTQQTPPSP